MNPILWALIETGFTFLMTTLGAAVVFLFRRSIHEIFSASFLALPQVV